MLLVLLGFATVAIVDLIPLIKCKSKKDTTAFCVLFFLALIFGIIGSSKAEIPTLMSLLSDFLEKLGICYKD